MAPTNRTAAFYISNFTAHLSLIKIQVSPFTAHTLYDPAAILAARGNNPVLTPKAFRELVPKLGAPPKPIGKRYHTSSHGFIQNLKRMDNNTLLVELELLPFCRLHGACYIATVGEHVCVVICPFSLSLHSCA